MLLTDFGIIHPLQFARQKLGFCMYRHFRKRPTVQK